MLCAQISVRAHQDFFDEEATNEADDYEVIEEIDESVIEEELNSVNDNYLE